MPVRLEIRPPAPPQRIGAGAGSRWSTRVRLQVGWLPTLVAVAMVMGALVGLAVQQSASQADLEVRAAELPTESRAVLIDLNSATIAELSTLPGIGYRRAEAIVLVRAARPFDSLADLADRGILRTSEVLAIAELATVYVSKD